MLDIGTPPQQIAGLSVFADHADEYVRYVTPNAPALTRVDDAPQLHLAMFRGNQSGALLSFEAGLMPTEEQLEVVRTELVTDRELLLLQPSWQDGSMQLAGWLQVDELEPLRLELTPPSVMGSPRAIAAARLDRDAAALAQAAIDGGMLPTVVIFDLGFLALAGPLGIRVEADLQALHDRLTAKGALETPVGRAQIQATWEEALRDNVIRVELLDQSLDFDSARHIALKRMGEDLIAKMFSPYPPPERPPMLDDQKIAQIELSFRLTMRREELDTRASWSFVERQAVRLRHYAAASLIDMLGEDPPQNHVSTIDLDPPTRDVLIRTEPELGRLGMAAIEVDVAWSAVDRADDTYVLTDNEPEFIFATDTDWDTLLRHRVRARYDPTVTDAPDAESTWATSTGGFIRVSPQRLFPPKSLTVILGDAELDWIDHVEVLVRLSETRSRSLVLGESQRSADLYLPGAGDTPLDLTVHWRGKAGEPSRTIEMSSLESDLVVLDSPFGSSISTFVVPRLMPGVMSLLLDLEYNDGERLHERTLEWTPESREPQTLSFRRPTDAPKTYRYRTIAMFEDGNVEESDWTDTDATQLVPGGDGPVDLHHVTTVLLGGGVAGRGAIAAEVVLATGDFDARTLLEQEQERAELVLLVPEDSPHPELVVTEFLVTGGTRETRITDPGQLAVVPPPPAAPDPAPE